MDREELRKQGERLKKEIKSLADTLDRREKLRLKIELMKGEDCSETTARLLLQGRYEKSPRQTLIENLEDTLANFRKAKAS